MDHQFSAFDVKLNSGSGADLTREHHSRQRVLDQTLDGAFEGPCAEVRIEALVGQEPGGGVRGSYLEALIGEQPVEVGELDVDDLFDVLLGEAVEDQDLVDAIEELGPEVLLELRLDQGRHPIALRFRQLLNDAGGDVRRHDDDRVAEVSGPALAVGEPALVEELEENIEDVGVGLFNLVKEQHRVGPPPNGFGELAAFIVADITWRGTDHPCHRVFLHVLRHVDADHRPFVVEKELGQ